MQNAIFRILPRTPVLHVAGVSMNAEMYGCILWKIAGADHRMDNKKRGEAGH